MKLVRPYLELMLGVSLSLAIWLTFHGAYRELVLIMLMGSAAFFSFRLRLPTGPYRQQILFELRACLPCFIIGSLLWLTAVLFAPEITPLLPKSLAFIIIAFGSVRLGLHFWRFWNQVRQTQLMWTLTHAHMVVALVLIGSGLITAMTLSALYPIRQAIEIFPLALTTLLVILPLLVALLGISAAFSYIVIRPTLQRLQSLVVSTDQLSHGDYTARSPVSGKDEVTRLQVNFNQMAAELERTVSELRSERDAVSKLLQLRRELMTSVSHELRTPITTLRGYIEAMLRRQENTPLPESFHHDLDILASEITRLQKLVDDLFTLARIETQQLPIKVEPTDTLSLVNHVVEAVAPLAWSAYRVQVIADISDNVPLAKADAVRIEQVLRNLLQNSLQHTPPGGIITIELNRSADEQQIMLSVEDTGEGIGEADLPHIWERFYRGKNTSNRDGTGLGLAVVKELTEAMGGQVMVRNVSPHGCRFTVHLPSAEESTIKR